jgi:hypothetical protein
MKQVLAILMVMLALAACTSTGKQESNSGTPLDQFVDSITKVYPNYAGNITVQNKISAELEKRISPLPGILEGTKFMFDNVAEIGGSILIMFSLAGETSAGVTTLLVSCDDFDKDIAATLDNTKTYKITGGTVVNFEAQRGVAEQWLYLGKVDVKDLKVEEI